MKSREQVYKKLLELRKTKKELRSLSGYVSGPSEAEVEYDLDRILPQIEILKWVLKDNK